MALLKFIVSVLLAAAATFLYVTWARNKSETQIGRMQLNSYNTPGAETPVPPTVLGSALGAIGLVWFLQRRLMRNSTVPAVVALLLGGAAGVGAVIYLSEAKDG